MRDAVFGGISAWKAIGSARSIVREYFVATTQWSRLGSTSAPTISSLSPSV